MVKYDFINWDSLSKPIEKLPEYWEKSSCPLLPRSLCSWNIPVGILEQSSTAPGLSDIRCNAQIVPSFTPLQLLKEVQLAIFGPPECSGISEWVTETHLIHLSAAFRFLGVYKYLFSYRNNIRHNLIKGQKIHYYFYRAAELVLSPVPCGFRASDLTAHLNAKMSYAILYLSLSQPVLPFYSKCQVFDENTSVIVCWCLFLGFPGTWMFCNMSQTFLNPWVKIATEKHNTKWLSSWFKVCCELAGKIPASRRKFDKISDC